jgi:putative membrane protein
MEDHGHRHEHHAGGGAGLPWETILPATALLLLALGYTALVHRAQARNPARKWGRWRTASFLTGCLLLAGALLPPIASWAHRDFRGHMLQHLSVGMYAPLALVLGAPITLVLRVLPTGDARRLSRFLRSRRLRPLTHPVGALVLSVGGLGVLYFTPLYDATAHRPAAHWVVHVHFLLSGFLFAWVIAGPDPAPKRPSVPIRLGVLGVAVAAHATLSQLMYGGFLVAVHAPADQVRGAGSGWRRSARVGGRQATARAVRARRQAGRA